MIAYSDASQLMLAPEETWAGAYDAFRPLPFLRETLTPEHRPIRVDSLGQDRGQPPQIAESIVTGDLECLATARNLSLLLPMVLHRPPLGEDHALPETFNLPSNVSFPPTQASLSTRFIPGERPSSARFAKTYRDGEEWLVCDGVMVQRLTFDLSDQQFFTLTASVLGRSMTVANALPAAVPEAEYPLGLAETLTHFHIKQTDDAKGRIDHENSIITGFRLVLERQGMAPQYGLGDDAPRGIIPGTLNAYGVLELVLADYRLFSWMTEQTALETAMVLRDGQGGGAALTLPQVILTETDITAHGEGNPLRAQFHFEVTRLSDHPLLSFVTAQPSAN